MKRITCLIVLILSFSMLFSISRKQAMDKWMTIVSEQDQQIKLAKLEDFIKEYEYKDDQIGQLICANLVATSYQLKQYDKTIEYGEKALAVLPNIEVSEKMKIYLALANAYYVTKADMKKSYDHADSLIKLVRLFQETVKGTSLDIMYIAPALRLQAKILFDPSGQNSDKTIKALNKAMESLMIDQSDVSFNLVLLLANEAVKQNRVDEALVIFEKIFKMRPSIELAKAIGYIYGRKGNDAKTMEFLMVSYQLQKSADVAYNLGILHNKIQDIDNAIKYFAESFVLYEKAGNDLSNMVKAENTLKHLYVNVKMKGVANQKEKDKGYGEVLAAARLSIEEKSQ